MTNIIVCGSRYFTDFATFSTVLEDYLKDFNKSEICLFSGGANGTDKLVIQYAEKNGIKCQIFPAFWGKFGKSAGPIRNRWMLKNANACFGFHDGKSLGTAHMLYISKQKGIPTKVYHFLKNTPV
ncbi:MAG: SLOG family protein [Flavobacteriaceae bacterium]|nr:SLOG family protein [Flavobacteriaceae bacterium]